MVVIYSVFYLLLFFPPTKSIYLNYCACTDGSFVFNLKLHSLCVPGWYTWKALTTCIRAPTITARNETTTNKRFWLYTRLQSFRKPTFLMLITLNWLNANLPDKGNSNYTYFFIFIFYLDAGAAGNRLLPAYVCE